MKKRVTERVLVLMLSMAVLLSSTGIYSVFAETYSEAVSSSTTESSSSSAAESVNVSANEKSQETTIPANVVAEGGTVENEDLKGSGTESDPYLISDADDLFKMQEKVNDSHSRDKIFALTNDIDLSSVSYAQMKANNVLPGTIVSVDKSKSDAAPNAVKFILNGRNHKIFGLNIDNTGSAGAAIFGYISAKSIIKYVNFENITVNVSYRKAVVNSAIALYNNGEIRNCTAKKIDINVRSSSYGRADSKSIGALELSEATGLVGINSGRMSNIEISKTEFNVNAAKNNIGVVAGANEGRISQIKASALINTSDCDAVGGIAGRNTGVIEASTVENFKAYVTSGAAAGGIAGKNAGTITSCVVSGKLLGSKYTGGIVGKAVALGSNEKASRVKNCYTFARVDAISETGAVVAAGETRFADNVWSSETSGRVKGYANGSVDGDLERDTKFVVVKKGETKTILKSALAGEFKDAKYVLDTTKPISYEGSGISCQKAREGIVISASQAGKIGKVTYTAYVAVQAGYADSAVVSQNYSIIILTVPEGTKGDGLTEETALEISNGAELRMISAVPYAHFALDKNITMPDNWDSDFSFEGTINGNGHKIYASDSFCKKISGKVQNLDVVLTGKISSAMFGSAEDARFSNVKLVKSDKADEKTFTGLSASKSGTAAFLNSVSGKTVIKDCFCDVPVYVSDNEISSVAGFIGTLKGDDVTITSCGVSTSITAKNDEKVSACAAFIGSADENSNGSIKNCYAALYSDVAKYAVIGGGNKNIKIENTVYSASNENGKAAPSKLKNVEAEKWMFESGENGFVTGEGSVVSIALPSAVIDTEKFGSKDFKVMFDAKDLSVDLDGMTVENKVASIPVEIAKEGATVRNSSLVLVHKETGLRAEIKISNGLEKDDKGNYLLNCGADFTYINDNFDNFCDKSYVLTKDIDMSSVKFTTVGGAAGAFTGSIDGNGHSIVGFSSESEAKSALFGTLDGATIKNITFKDASVKSESSYAAVLASQIKGGTVISSVKFENCCVSAEENFAGVLAGEIKDSTVKNITVSDSKIKAMNNAGALAAVAENSKLEKIAVENTAVSGDNNIGVIGEANNSSVKAVTVDDSKFSAKQTVGGVVGTAEQIKLSSANVSGTKITAESDALGSAPVAGGVCGVLNGTVGKVEIESTKIVANGTAAIAGGVAAVSENAAVKSADIGKKVSVKASVVGGIIGEASGKTEIKDSKSFAKVIGSEKSTKVIEGAGGVIGRVSADDLGLVTINKTNTAGEVSAADYAGGVIGSVLSQKTGESAITDCVSASTVKETSADENSTSGHVIGYVAYLNEDAVSEAVSDVVFSSYGSEIDAYGNVDAPKTYVDLDRAVESSLTNVITDEKPVTVKVSNDLASELGFVFDEAEGWKSDSEARIDVLSSTENSVKLAADENGKIAVVGTYVLSDDDEIAVDVHFDAETDIDIKLNGNGTKENPYIISNASELEAVSEYAGEKAYFEVTADIAFKAEDFEFGGEFYNDGKGFKPIGTNSVPFNGTFNGNSHKISGIVINDAEIGGLFGCVTGAEISNVVIEKASVNAVSLASGLAAKVRDSKITSVNVSDSKIVAESSEGSAAAIAAYSAGSTISDIKVTSTEITACEFESAYNTAYAGGVCARAVETAVEKVVIDRETKVTSDGTAAGFIGYNNGVSVKDSRTYASVAGCNASAVAGSIDGLFSISNVAVGGTVAGKEYAAGIAAKAFAAIKANGVVISAKISGEKYKAVAVSAADGKVFTDSSDCEVEFKNVLYSSYQNSFDAFATARINTYQNTTYLNGIVDVNTASAKDGKALVIGKEAVDLSKAIVSEYDLTMFSCVDVYSEPSGLVDYNKLNGTVKAVGTDTDGAKLVMKYDNGLEVAVDMVCIEGMAGNGTSSAPYVISSEETLELLRLYPNAEFVLEKDIVLEKEWTPVDNFTGKLDGQGFEIAGLNVKADNAGLFSSLGDNAEVKNITFKDASVTGKTFAGVVAASVTGNAKINGINVVSSNVKADEYAAAIAGSVQTASTLIKECNVAGCTVSAKDASGVAALVSGKAEIDSITVESTEIKGTKAAGGIVAVASSEKLAITKSSVSADTSAENAGGIAGITEKSIAIAGCTVEGNIAGVACEGGIIGNADGKVSVKTSKALAALSGNAKNTAEIVAKFATRPADDEQFAQNFADNTISGEFNEFEPAIMQYQNFTSARKSDKPVSLKGSGTEEDPYIISSAKDLAKIPDSSTDYFVLGADITIKESDYGISINKDGETIYGVFSDGYKPVKNFAGTFDGKGHVIKGLYIDSDADYVGLFANITAKGSVKNLHVELLSESEESSYCGIKGRTFVGGIAGYCESESGIQNCSVAGSKISGEAGVGGLVGCLASSKIISSFAMTEIIAQSKAGGLAGIVKGDSAISGCFTSSKVNAAGGMIVGANSGNLVMTDVMANGTSHGTGAVAVALNGGTIKASKVLIAGSNEDKKSVILGADEAKYVYSDRTSLGITEEGITALSTAELTSSKPEGLDKWAQNEGKYPVPVMNDDYSNSMADKAATLDREVSKEASTGNVAVTYKLTNNSGDRSMNTKLAGILIKSKANGTIVTSDFYTTCTGEIKPLNRITVTTGGFYVDSDLPTGYSFQLKAKDSHGSSIKVSDAGSMGWYVECGAETEVSLEISIIKTEIPWGVFSLWESLVR